MISYFRLDTDWATWYFGGMKSKKYPAKDLSPKERMSYLLNGLAIIYGISLTP